MRRSYVPYLVLAGGVLVVATASIMIRYAQNAGLSSLLIAAGRLGLAALILTPIAWRRVGGELRGLSRREWLLGAASGTLLAAHFWAWISSLAFTSVASSAALVATNPLWVGLASLLLLRERLAPGAVVGLMLTFGGSLLIVISDSSGPATGAAPLLGNALALLGALTVSGYFLIGRSLRRHISLLAYIWVVYSCAALILVTAALLSGERLLGFPPYAYLLLLALAVGPQLLGHTAFNWSLGYLSATFVAVAILGEPVGSALLALLAFGERFAPLQLAGFALLLLGISIAAMGERNEGPASLVAEPEP